MDQAQILFWIPIAVTLIGTVFVGINVLKLTKNIRSAILSATLLNILLLGMASFWWINYSADSMSQYLGVILYAISAVIILFADVGAVFWWRNSRSVV